MELFAALLLLFGGCYCTVKLRFVQFTRLSSALRNVVDTRSAGGISPFEAMATSLGATIGTGNIAGVAGAILFGGPGTVFWMWISALVGMASKYADIYFGMRYRTGDCIGPMAYMSFGLPVRMRWLGGAYALCCMAACLCMGNLVQINAITEAMQTTLAAFDAPAANAFWPKLLVGIMAAVTVMGASLGGAKRVGKLAALLVPAMSVVYILGAVYVILRNVSEIPAAFRTILVHVREPSAFLVGIARGTFTHEAGLGTAAIAHGGASCNDAHRQALYGVFEVFFDTIIICTLTAFAVLTSGVELSMRQQVKNSAFVIDAFAVTLGKKQASACIAVSLALFAFSSVLSFSYYGGVCARFVLGKRGESAFQTVFPLFLIIGAVLKVSVVWRLAEWANVFMALLNMAALVLLLRQHRVPDIQKRFTPARNVRVNPQ